jgi:predicted NBD/HSP70 family sugar kinase
MDAAGRTLSTASGDPVRKRNLARLLTLIHERGPVSRSALTRETGLNRSTVGTLIGELHSLGLVVEGEPAAATAAGRPSPMVSAATTVVALALNPEIDAVTLGVIGLDGVEHTRVRRPVSQVPTPADVIALTLEILAEIADDLAGRRVVGIGVAVPGIVRDEDGLVRVAPHLGWYEEPFADALRAATGYPVRASNDAHLGVRAEHLRGSGRGWDDVVYINGGASGIGSGVITSGRVLGGRGGYAGELGHTFVDPRGAACHCGSTGCLETVVSQSALLAAAGVDVDAHPDRSGGDLVAEALASAGDRLEAEVSAQLEFLAIALRNVIVTVGPGIVILGGFLGQLFDHAGARLDELVTRQTFSVLRENVVLARTSLGSSILLHGAAELVFADVLNDPAAPPSFPRG